MVSADVNPNPGPPSSVTDSLSQGSEDFTYYPCGLHLARDLGGPSGML